MRPAVFSFFALLMSIVGLLAASPPVTEKEVLGSWYCSNHLGHDVVLTLSPDHIFRATWSGDDGTYGKSKGSWQLEGGRLVIKATGSWQVQGGVLSLSPTGLTKDTKGETLLIERREGKILLARARPSKTPPIFVNSRMIFARPNK